MTTVNQRRFNFRGLGYLLGGLSVFMFAVGVHFALETYNRFLGEESDKVFVPSTSAAAQRGYAEHWEASRPAKVLRANPEAARATWLASCLLLALAWFFAMIGRWHNEPDTPKDKGNPLLKAGLLGLVTGGLLGPVFKLLPAGVFAIPPIVLLLWWSKRRHIKPQPREP